MSRLRIALLALVALVIGAVCIRLGFWQLERLAERRAENARVAAGLGGAPVPIESIGTDSTRSRALRVDLRGTYDFEREVVLVNRSRDGAPGVNILTPLRLPGRDTAVLVNRGWVYSPDGATVDLTRWLEQPDAVGTAYVSWLQGTPSSASLGEPAAGGSAPADGTTPGALPVDTSTRRVMRLAHASIAALLPYPIAPYQLVLIEETSSPGGEGARDEGPAPFGTAVVDSTRPVRIPLPALDEGPHRSYALQWFAFAAIALIGTGAVAWKEWTSRARPAPL